MAESIPSAALRPSRRRRVTADRAAGWVAAGSYLNLLAVLLVWGLIGWVSEQWWVGTVATYLPRAGFAVPALVLMVCGWKWHHRSIAVNGVALGLVAWPMMGWVIPWGSPASTIPAHDAIKILSCNVQNYEPDFATVLQEVSRVNPHIVAFQEARDESSLLTKYFDGWHSVKVDELWIGSKFPLRLVDECYTEIWGYRRITAIAVEVETSAGPVLVCNLHLMTARRGLEELSLGSIIRGDGPEVLEEHVAMRAEESRLVRAWLSQLAKSQPLLIAGDFNMPASSSVFQADWAGFDNAFDRGGWGYGYTAPCRSHRYWPPNTPWLRIDHILANGDWRIHNCHIGSRAGSDHRLIAAEVSMTR